MSAFYGRLQGNRGEATRGGSKDSGIRTTAESWTSIVHTYHGQYGAQVRVTDKHSNSIGALWAFDADRLVNHSDHPLIKGILAEIEENFNELDDQLGNLEDLEERIG